MKLRILSIALLCLLAACGSSKRIDLAADEVVKFHQALNAEQFEAIYDGSGKELKQLAKRDKFIAMLKNMHRKLGKAGDSRRMSWNVKYQTSGTMVTMDFATKYSDYTVKERFIYKVGSDKASLVGYHFRVPDMQEKDWQNDFELTET